MAWDDVQDMSLRFGFQSKHPLIQALVGAALTLAGGYLLLLQLLWLLPKVVGFKATVLLLPLGLWMLWDALRRRYYLEIGVPNRAKRLHFKKIADPSELSAFLSEVERRFHCRIRR